MLVIKQKWISRLDLIQNPTILYIFGDNLQRVGMGGQAGEMRGERNSFGIATKRSPTQNGVFYDKDPDVFQVIDSEFEKLYTKLQEENYDAIVVPMDGIGTGLANLQTFAPKLLTHINLKLEALSIY